MIKLLIPDNALLHQKKATSPSHSVWVKANAGSGKTHVLTERVIRLLLEGTSPSHILCLTYTEAAASVMKARIFSNLKEWPLLSNEALREKLYALGQEKVDDKDLDFARRLFAKALETPGGLKIQTIHAFCYSLLQRFPLEANLSGYFALIEDDKNKLLFEETIQLALAKAFQDEGGDLNYVVEALLPKIGETKLRYFIEEVFQKRYLLKDFYQQVKNSGQTFKTVYQKILGLKNENLSFDAFYDSLEASKFFPKEHIEVLKKSNKLTPQKHGRKLEDLQRLDKSDGEILLKILCDCFLTQKYELRNVDRIYIKEIQNQYPDLAENFRKKQEDFYQKWQLYKNLSLWDENVKLVPFIQTLIDLYENLKKKQGLLDYEDLIYGTLYLLRRSRAHLWVQYKLDQGIDHILLDEAQDTNKAQWEIVQILSQEFFAGEGQREKNRTIFAVGDEKQAIYGFRGANPRSFEENGRQILKKIAPVQEGSIDKRKKETFQNVGLNYSFRSSPTLLKAVDKVFSKEDNYRGLSYPEEKTSHYAIKKDPGRIDIWPIFFKNDEKEPEDWLEGLEIQAAPAVRMARAIAEQIDDWLKEKLILKSLQRPISAGDIIILVRERKSAFLGTLTRALKQKNIAVSGADKFLLSDHIAVQDLLALGQFVLQPFDDLSLASLFKSPIFNLSESDLYDIAALRGSKSLWVAFQSVQFCEGSAAFRMRQALQEYRAMADTMPVFDFYSYILTVAGARAAFIGRFGREVEDVLDEFMNSCLKYQEQSYKGLQGFLENFLQNSIEIKRNFDQEGNEIRILTVHGAKGLEAPVVFLVDFGKDPRGNSKLPLFYDFVYEGKNVPIFATKIDSSTKMILDKEEHNKILALEEYRRLLYVGMTRAKDYLLLVSSGKKEKPKAKNKKDQVEGVIKQKFWVNMVMEALEDEAIKMDCEREDFEENYFLSYQPEGDIFESSTKMPLLSDKNFTENQENFYQNYLYLKQNFVEAEKNFPPLMPSQIRGEDQFYIDDSDVIDEKQDKNFTLFMKKASQEAIKYGQIFHKILQYLPNVAPSEQKPFIKNFFQQEGFTFHEQRDMEKKIEALLQDETLCFYFEQQGENEVSIKGTLEIKGKKRQIVGRIDRLINTQDKLYIVDYKTGFIPPSVDAIPFSTKIQMALYAKLLQNLYPKQKIEAVLLYTRAPKVYSLSWKELEGIYQAYAFA